MTNVIYKIVIYCNNIILCNTVINIVCYLKKSTKVWNKRMERHVIWIKLQLLELRRKKRGVCDQKLVVGESVCLTIGLFDSIKDGWSDIERTTDRSPSWRSPRWNAPLATSKATLTLYRAAYSVPFCEPTPLDRFEEAYLRERRVPRVGNLRSSLG